MNRQVAAIAAVLLLVTLVPGTVHAASPGAMGSKVTFGGTDFVPTLQSLPAGVEAYLVRRDIGVASDQTDDAYYVHFGASGDSAISSGKDYRLNCGVAGTSCPSSAAAGRWVQSGDPDLATPTLAATASTTFASRLRYLEADDRNGWSTGDGLYVDLTGDASIGGLGTDIRIAKPGTATSASFSCSTCPIGEYVKTTDTDYTEANDGDREAPTSTSYATSNPFKVLWFDADMDTAVSREDTIYLKGPSAPTYAGMKSTHPDIGDVRLTQSDYNHFSGLSFGSMVTQGAADHRYTFSVMTPDLATANTADADLADQHMILHFDDPAGTDAVIRRGDVFLYRGPSGGSGGQLITSKAGDDASSPGAGTGALFNPATARLRYQDGSPSGFSVGDPIFVKNRANSGSNVEVGDLRLTQSGSYTAGSMVKAGEADVNLPLTADSKLVFKRFDSVGAQAQPLNSLQQIGSVSGTVMLVQTGAAHSGFAHATDDLFLDGSTSDIWIYDHTGSNAFGATCGSCSSSVSYSNVRVTGPDQVHDAGASEYVYDSNDAFLGPGDIRLSVGSLTSDKTVNSGEADVAELALVGNDVVIVDYDPTCATACSPFMHIGGVYVYGGSFGQRITASASGYVPTLTAFPATPKLVRYNRGESGAAFDDTFYLSAAGSANLVSNDVRLTRLESMTAGTLIKSSDTTYAEEAAGGTSFTVDSSGFGSRICYIDVNSRAGLQLEDPVYVIVPNSVFGSPFSSTTTSVQAFDLRLSPWPATGSASYSGGTIVLAGNSDLVSGQTTCATPPGSQSWQLAYWDQTGDSRFSASSSSTDDDVAYAMLGAAAYSNVPPPLHALRVNGPGTSANPSGPTSNPPTTTTTTGAPITTSTTPTGSGNVTTTATTSSSAESDSPTPTTSNRGGTPGFEAVFLLAAVVIGVGLLRRRPE